ncbi:MAG TPA: YdcF family protein [Bryobacteraceae bacterium]|nr:YdcF family protein [Bryobacteraceae bacterium]
MRHRGSLLIRFVIVMVLLIVLAILTRTWWLPAFGWALVRDDGPMKADIAVVLGGDPWGLRISKAGDLVRQGYVPVVLVSGPPGYYDEHECEPEIAWAVRHGYPQAWFIPYPDEARSTVDEAHVLLPELERRKVHRALFVTSNYHSRRAAYIIRAVEREMRVSIDVRMITSPDKEFHPATWWQSRQGQKITFNEWAKAVAAAIGL